MKVGSFLKEFKDEVAIVLSVIALLVSLIGIFKDQLFGFKLEVYEKGGVILGINQIPTDVKIKAEPSLSISLIIVNKGYSDEVIQNIVLLIHGRKDKSIKFCPAMAEVPSIKFIGASSFLPFSEINGFFPAFSIKERESIIKDFLFIQRQNKEFPHSDWQEDDYYVEVYVKDAISDKYKKYLSFTLPESGEWYQRWKDNISTMFYPGLRTYESFNNDLSKGNAAMDWNCIWGSVTAISTVALFFLGMWQLRKLNRTTSADFLHHFVVDFFTSDTRYLITLIDMDWIVFDRKDSIPVFRIKKDDEVRKIEHELGKSRSFFTVYEIDDLLLGQFEDMANLERKNVVDISMIYNTLSWYLETVWNNKEIQAYVKWHRSLKNCSNIYEDSEYLYNKCNLYAKSKNIGLR